MNYTDHYVSVNNINLHYIAFESNGGPAMLMMHGVTANAHAFDGVAAAGLANDFTLYSVDLRGRGLTDHPAFHYSVPNHADDILGLLDALGLGQVILCGHSFGGLLGTYLAANYPKRVSRLIILDAAAKLNPRTPELLAYRFAHLDTRYPSWQAYIDEVKAAPYITFWDDAMQSYYEADVRPTSAGGVTPRSNLANILQAASGLANIDWPGQFSHVQCPALLINAPDDYAEGEPILPDDYAKDTVAMLPHGHYVRVDGNHQTMLYGAGAKQIVKAIKHFVGDIVM